MPYFDYPLALFAAPVLAGATVLLLLAAFRRRAARLARLGSAEIVARLVPPTSTRTPWWRAALLAGAALCATLAFAGPRWGSEVAVVRGSGADIVLALDASLSMLATDERPNRLEKMKQEARRLLATSSGDRYGLIAFAGRSYILTPLTVDRGALELFLDNLDPSVVGQAGSSLARALRQGTDLLLSSKTESDRALVVMSDGESFEPESDVADAAKRAAEAGITLVTVGFGTTGGSTIPIQGQEGATVKRDENNEVVVTRYTPSMLQAAATAAGGTFIDAGTTDKAARIQRAVSSLRRERRQSESGRDRRPQFQWFLAPALLLALLDTVLAERRGRHRNAPAASAVAASVLLMLALPSIARADDAADGDRFFRRGRFRDAVESYQRAVRSGNQDPRLLYNLGTALMAAGRADEATSVLERAATTRDADLRYRSLFNLGLVHLRRGLAAKGDAADPELGAAAEAYKRALRIRPAEHDAKWNYELANRDTKKSGGGGGGGGNQNPQPSAPQPGPEEQRPSGALDRRRADQVLNSAEREEREVQGKKQRNNPQDRPRLGKDW